MADAKRSFCTLYIVCLFVRSFYCENFKRLVPEQLLTNQRLYNNETTIYILSKLENGSKYELRISYPATIPSRFLIKVTSSSIELTGNTRRRILNIEKATFTSVNPEHYASITAFRTGLPKDPARLQDPVLYNIILEKLYFGLPFEVWKTGLFIICSLIFVLVFILPRLEEFFQQENIKFTKSI